MPQPNLNKLLLIVRIGLGLFFAYNPYNSRDTGFYASGAMCFLALFSLKFFVCAFSSP